MDKRPARTTWFLEGFVDDTRKRVRAVVRTLPFAIGRHAGAALALHSKLVSGRHAELFLRDGALWIRDLRSTNGTFVNGELITAEHLLHEGDIIHFANLEFRLGMETQELALLPKTQTLNLREANFSGGGIARFREFRDMLRTGGVWCVFQPLIRLADGEVLGYEALGRGELDGVETAPSELFVLAESIGLAADLSAAFRTRGLDAARYLPPGPKVFVNTHPAELADAPRLLESMQEARSEHPELDIVLEIHESAVTSIKALRELRRELDKLGIGVAFDDFGKGQARLLELTDTAPNYLKFDAVFIRNLHRARKQKREMVRTLVKLALGMDIITVAEGVECEEEAQACAGLGFEYAQGFLYGRPRAAAGFAAAVTRSRL